MPCQCYCISMKSDANPSTISWSTIISSRPRIFIYFTYSYHRAYHPNPKQQLANNPWIHPRLRHWTLSKPWGQQKQRYAVDVVTKMSAQQRPQVQPCRYKTGKTLGAGSYSVVKECVHIDTGRYYAAKVINKRLMAGREHMVRTGLLPCLLVQHRVSRHWSQWIYLIRSEMR